ncbi:MAG TPA: acyl-CoA dehydrogenase family protein, partial [Polyangia bacterium]|nr:acyl-CoA dehydrogenase family protein [Polyangia bacterium]
YTIEASILKVFGTETLDFVADESLQILGGYGFTADYPVERHYRDSRINRIFEGTNEINRLLIPGRLLRRAMKGELPIFQKAMALMEEVAAAKATPAGPTGFLSAEAQMLAGAKKTALMCLGLAAQQFGEKLANEQEILGLFADIAMDTYALESALLRTQKRVAQAGAAATRLQENAVRCFAQDAMDRVDASARRILAALFQGEKLRPYLDALNRFTAREIVNTVELRRQIAVAASELGKYPLD